jgi:hypothetical protein
VVAEPLLEDPAEEIFPEEAAEDLFADEQTAEALAEPPAPKLEAKPAATEKAKPKKAKAAPKTALKTKTSAKGRK